MSSKKDFAKPYTITIPWTHSPVASKLGLRPQTVSPRAAHFVSWNYVIVPDVLLISFLQTHKQLRRQ